jgi:hypothetical protein
MLPSRFRCPGSPTGRQQNAWPLSCFSGRNAYLLANPEITPVLEKGEIAMALTICWLNDLAKAKETARQTKKPVLLDFFNPQ